jgi:hypothetical protein
VAERHALAGAVGDAYGFTEGAPLPASASRSAEAGGAGVETFSAATEARVAALRTPFAQAGVGAERLFARGMRSYTIDAAHAERSA